MHHCNASFVFKMVEKQVYMNSCVIFWLFLHSIWYDWAKNTACEHIKTIPILCPISCYNFIG